VGVLAFRRRGRKNMFLTSYWPHFRFFFVEEWISQKLSHPHTRFNPIKKKEVEEVELSKEGTSTR
jgi:hypothetical protein